MSSKLPWFKSYQDKWLTDVELNSCSLEAQAVWHRVCCVMRNAGGVGTLTKTPEQWAHLTSIEMAVLIENFDELRENNVGDFKLHPPYITVTSRFMLREHTERNGSAERQRNSRAKNNPQTYPQKTAVTAMSQGEDRGKKDSVPIGTGSMPSRTTDDSIWGIGVQLLVNQGTKEPGARAFLGKMIKKSSEETVAARIEEAYEHPKADVRAWLMAMCTRKPTSAVDRVEQANPEEDEPIEIN